MNIMLLNNIITPLLTQMPLPRDLTLPLPLGEAELKIILVILFLAHIFFINLMLGGSILAVLFEILGLKNPQFDKLGKKIAETITVNKSLAVVLGVGPLLCINLAYTIHFYSANAITGFAWISIVPLVTIAFLITYLHKYTWEKWTGPKKTRHIITGASATLLFLFIPLIFLANINLMLFPDQWGSVRGFFSSLRIGNVFPRYFHFLTASLALTGLVLAGWFGRRKYPVEEKLPGFSRPQLRKLFYKVTFYVTLAQFVFGPLLFLTLPWVGMSLELLIVILCGVTAALAVLLLLNREIKAPDDQVGRSYIAICLLLAVVVSLMGAGRHIYRETSLAAHKQMIQDESDRFAAIEYATHLRLAMGLDAGEAIGGGPTGEQVFINCAACHAVNKVLAAPSLVEVYSLYKDNPQGIIDWAKIPGKKRAEFQPMPSMAHLGEEKLALVADYMLEKGGEASGKLTPESSGVDRQK